MACKYQLNVTFIKGCGAVWMWDSPPLCLRGGCRWVNMPYCLEASGGGAGDPQSGVVLRDCICVCICVCVCAHAEMSKCVCARHLTHYADSLFFFSCPQPCAANEQRLDCRLQCEMSAACLSACDMSFWRERVSSITPPARRLFLVFFAEVLVCFFRRDGSPQREPLRKTHWSFPLLMLCCWHAAAFGPIIPVFRRNDWLHMCIFIYVKCPSRSQGDLSACPSLKCLPTLC